MYSLDREATALGSSQGIDGKPSSKPTPRSLETRIDFDLPESAPAVHFEGYGYHRPTSGFLTMRRGLGSGDQPSPSPMIFLKALTPSEIWARWGGLDGVGSDADDSGFSPIEALPRGLREDILRILETVVPAQLAPEVASEDPLRVHMASRPGEVLYAANVRQKRLLELADRAVIVAREVQADPARQRSNPFG